MEVESSNVVISTPKLYDVAPVDSIRVTPSKSFCDVDELPKQPKDSPPSKKSETLERKVDAEPIATSPAPPVVANTNVGKYRLLRTIGKGNFAKVKLAIHMATGVEVAIKIINKTVMDNTLLKRLKREITIMKITNHPNIVRLLEIIENEDVLCLVMEYASGGEIFDYLVSNGKMRESEARVKFRQLVSAIQYCHSKKVVHRDLKAENILLDKDLNVKVADFGLANSFELGQRLTTFCGSPPYAAPELFLGIPYFGPSVDVWSLGVILFTLVLGHLPFDARDLRELRSKILSLNYTIPRGSISPECEALLRKMLILDPKDRSSLKALMQDKWINMGYPPSECLCPYKEPSKSQLDELRVKAMEAMGFTQSEIESSVVNPEFDHVYATYHLLPEIPSQFVSFCDESAAKNSQSQPVVLPDSLVEPVHKTTSTAIGRFTVAPSNKSAEQNSQSTPTTTATKIPTSATEPTREHHSLTSTLPVALRRAFHHVGRTFGGGTGLPANAAGNVDPQARVHGGYTRPTKPVAKSNGARNVITAAPVPIGAVKKTGFGVSQPSKRPVQQTTHLSPTGLDTNPQPVSAHTGRSGSQQHTPQLVVRPNSNLQTTSQPKSDITTHKLHSNSPKQSKQDYDGRALKMPNSRSVANATTITHVNTSLINPPTTLNQVAQTLNGPVKPVNGPSGASSSDEQEVRETAALLVNHVWRSVEPFANDHSTESNKKSTKQPIDTLNNVNLSKTAQNGYSIVEPIGPRSEKPEISRSLTNINEQPKDKSDASDVKQSEEISTQSKVLHTVQGNEAVALRNQALRMQSGTGATNSPACQSPNYETIDSNHQTTWGRGVLKALGGLFVQNKSLDNNHIRTINKPREVRFPWSVHTTSTKTADDLLQSIVEALDSIPGCRYTHDPHLPFLLQCSWAANRDAVKPKSEPPGSDAPATNTVSNIAPQFEDLRPSSLLRGDPVHWEMEVCQLPRVHLRGVRLKRIRGSTLHFRPIADLVMKALKL